MEPQAPISFKQSFQLLKTYLRPEWKRVCLLLLLLFSGIGLQLIQPQVLRDFIDIAVGNIEASLFGGIQSIGALAILFLAVSLLNQLLRGAATYVTQDVRWRTTNALRADLAAHCMRLDMGFHNNRTPGAMISRVDEDVNLLSNFFSQFILQVLGNAILILGVIAVLWGQHWTIGLGFALFVVVTSLAVQSVIGLAIPHLRNFFAMGEQLFAFIEERLAGTIDIRSNGAAAYTMLRLHQTLRAQYLIEQKAYSLSMLTFMVTQGLFSVGTALGLGLGGYLFNQNLITIGTVYLIVNYAAMLHRPLQRLTQQIQDLQRAVAAASRVQELYFTTSQLIDDPQADATLGDKPIAVTFDKVAFHYAEDTPVLKEVSLTLEAGQHLGLLGRTGSGKTTMTRLIFRLYDAVAGTVALDNRPVSHYPIQTLRSKIGMVTQEVQLFNATIRDNLTFFNADIHDGQIMTALQDLELMDWFRSLADGLDTIIEPGGRGLSAGEGQLLAFTRVFLKDPQLIIMDEASSRLDPATEALIERAVDKLLANRSAIIVAHRLATVQRVDDILILEDGHVKEYGKRETLVADPNSHFSTLLQTGLAEVLV